MPTYITSYKGISISTTTQIYPTDELSLTGGFNGSLSHSNGAWDGSKVSGTVMSINAVDFTNIKTLKITHGMNKWASSTTLTTTNKVGLVDASGTWIKQATRTISTQGNNSWTETFDVSSLTGLYYIAYYYYHCNRTSGNISSIYIQG